jgi:hypothetical protein
MFVRPASLQSVPSSRNIAAVELVYKSMKQYKNASNDAFSAASACLLVCGLLARIAGRWLLALPSFPSPILFTYPVRLNSGKLSADSRVSRISLLAEQATEPLHMSQSRWPLVSVMAYIIYHTTRHVTPNSVCVRIVQHGKQHFSSDCHMSHLLRTGIPVKAL